MHLLESASLENYITSYPEAGDNKVTRKMTKTSIGFEHHRDTNRSRNPNENLGKTWINDTQYFDNVPLVA